MFDQVFQGDPARADGFEQAMRLLDHFPEHEPRVLLRIASRLEASTTSSYELGMAQALRVAAAEAADAEDERLARELHPAGADIVELQAAVRDRLA